MHKNLWPELSYATSKETYKPYIYGRKFWGKSNWPQCHGSIIRGI